MLKNRYGVEKFQSAWDSYQKNGNEAKSEDFDNCDEYDNAIEIKQVRAP